MQIGARRERIHRPGVHQRSVRRTAVMVRSQRRPHEYPGQLSRVVQPGAHDADRLERVLRQPGLVGPVGYARRPGFLDHKATS